MTGANESNSLPPNTNPADPTNADGLRSQLVSYLVREGAIRSPRLEQAFLRVPREFFLPAAIPLTKVYTDDAIVVKWDEQKIPSSSSTQPFLMADMLETLRVEPGMRVLEIGAGVGYNAAILTSLLEDGSHLTSVELDPEMANIARQNLRRLATHLPQAGYDRVNVISGDGSLGYAAHAPYDRIIVTVQQWEIAPAWVEQLKEGGLLLLPLTISKQLWGGLIPAFQKDPDGLLRAISTSYGSFMPMRGQLAHPTHDTEGGGIGSLPLNPNKLWPDLAEPGRLAVALGGMPAALVEFLKQKDLVATATGQETLELPPTDPSLGPVKTAPLFQGFSLALAVARAYQLHTLYLAQPQPPETTGKEGWLYVPRGLAVFEPTEEGYDLALLVTTGANDAPIRLLSGWRLSQTNAQPEPPPPNGAVDKIRQVWHDWRAMGGPDVYHYRPIAFPADQPPPAPGYVVTRQFYNLLLPFGSSKTN